MVEQDGISEVRWAPRVNPSAIRRLYETDAQGIVDEDQIDDVGYALYARCRSILRATEASRGRVTCPRCEHAVVRAAAGAGDNRDEIVACERCGWRVRWRDYFQTFQHKHLTGGGATEMHRAFVEQFERARSPREKMLAIDRLIHTFHWELVSNPGRSAARELIYAKNNRELLTFLDRLTYGEGSTPGLREQKAVWDRKLESSLWHQQTGFRPDPQTESPDERATPDATGDGAMRGRSSADRAARPPRQSPLQWRMPSDVTIELDTAPRTVEAPDDVAATLNTDSSLRQAFDDLSPSHRKAYVDWIAGAKRDETRRRRIKKMATMLRDGIRTPKS